MPRYEPWNTERASAIIAAHKDQDGAALPIFHALQHVFGFVPEEAIPMVAEALNLSRAEMYGNRHFLSRFPQGAAWPPRAEALPRRIVPSRGWRGIGGAGGG